MLIPSFSLQENEECSKLYFRDTTCAYDPVSCSCGYNSPNPSRLDITRTEIIITTPSDEQITLDKNYLPSNPATLSITCSDLTIAPSVQLTPAINDCGCGTITANATTSVAGSCFQDGCWTFVYNVYASEDVTTYEWDLTSISGGSIFPGYCVTITIDGNPYTSDDYLSDVSEIKDWLNTLNLGAFTVTDDVISTSSFEHTYGNVTTETDPVSYTISFAGCSAFAFPATLDSVTIDGTTYAIGQEASSWSDVVAFINLLGVGTYLSGGYNPSSREGIIEAGSCSAGIITDISFDTSCDGMITRFDPSTNTFTPSTHSTTEEALVGTSTKTEFLYCNIKKAIKDFKLTQFAQDCGCLPDLQLRICDLDADYATMLISAENGTGTCDCACSTNYLNKLQNNLSNLQNLCQ